MRRLKTYKFGTFNIIGYFTKFMYSMIIGRLTKQPMLALPILMLTLVLMGFFMLIVINRILKNIIQQY